MILKNNRVTVDEEEFFENLVKLVEVSIFFSWRYLDNFLLLLALPKRGRRVVYKIAYSC